MAMVLGLLPVKVLSTTTMLQVWVCGLLKMESSTNLSIHKLSSYTFAQLRSSVQTGIRLCDQTFLLAPLMSLRVPPLPAHGLSQHTGKSEQGQESALPAGPFRDARSQPHQPTLPTELCRRALVFAPAAARQQVLCHCLVTPPHQPARLPGWT